MKQCMIKDDVVDEVSQCNRVPKQIVENVIDSTLNIIIAALSQGKGVQLKGFGTFEPKYRAARTGRNPRTNEPFPIPARVVPSFRAGKKLKDAVIKGDD